MILTGILFVLKTGIAWDDLPAELGCGCGKTCRRYYPGKKVNQHLPLGLVPGREYPESWSPEPPERCCHGDPSA
jgi:hypothetical protein